MGFGGTPYKPPKAATRISKTAKDNLQVLKDPKSLFAATSAQDPYVMAQKAVELGMKVLNGESLEAKTVLIPVELVTRDNVKDYKGWTK